MPAEIIAYLGFTALTKRPTEDVLTHGAGLQTVSKYSLSAATKSFRRSSVPCQI